MKMGKKKRKREKRKRNRIKKKHFLDRSETDSALNLVMVATEWVESKCNKFFPPLPLLKILKYCQKFGRKEVDENHFSD